MNNTGSSFVCTNILDRDMVIYFDYKITHYGCPAKTYGPPENCYPAEPMEYEVTFSGIIEDVPNFKNKIPPNYLDTPSWLVNIIEEYLNNSNEVYEIINQEQSDIFNDEREYDEDYYRDH